MLAIAISQDSSVTVTVDDNATVNIKSSTTEEPIATPSTIVDILSSRPQYSYFLRHLQRQGMIPKLNSLHNVTLFAPINLAFVRSQLELTSHELLRYIVNQKFRIGYLGKQQVVFDTLFDVNGTPYPVSIAPDFETLEYVVDDVAHIIDGDVYAKHQHSFVQGLDSLLPMKPTICDVLLNHSDSNISFIKKLLKLLFQNVEDEMDDDKKHDEEDDDIDMSIFENLQSTSKKSKKPSFKEPPLPRSCEEYLSQFQTVLIPTDSFIERSLSELQRKYYLSNYYDDDTPNYFTTKEAEKEVSHDIVRLLDNLLVEGLIAGVNGTNSTIQTKSGNKLSVSLRNSTTIVLNDHITSRDTQVLSNGVIHTFDLQDGSFFEDLNMPPVEIIPRKALYAMHFSNFVKELDFRSLDYLIDGSLGNQTLFIDVDARDDIDDEDVVSSSLGSTLKFSSKQELLYQFAKEPIPHPSGNHVHKLYTSKLCSKKKLGGCFKLKFSSSVSNGVNKITINDDATIVEGPVDMGNTTLLYISDGEISPPPNFKHALGDLISGKSIHRHQDVIEIDVQGCLKTLSYLGEHGLTSLEDNEAGYTVFLPCGYKQVKEVGKNAAPGVWGELGLVLKYLEANPELFEQVLRANFIEDDIYSDFGLLGKPKQVTLKNLNGNNVILKSVSLKDDTVNVFAYNNTEIPIPLNSDVFFSQGVIHVINDLLLPDTFTIPFEGLIATTLDSSFPDYSFDELLKLFPKIRHALGLDGSKKRLYSLLIPTPESLKDFNITTSFIDLLKFIEFHMVLNEDLVKILDCMNGIDYHDDKTSTNDSVIRTNLTSAGLICKHVPQSKNTYLQYHEISKEEISIVSYNKDQEVKILSHGCTSMYKHGDNTDDLSCVFLIEKPLNLNWISKGDQFPHIHLGFISVGVGIILGLILFGGIMLILLFCLGGIGRNHKNDSSNQVLFPRPDSGFMSVLTDDDNEFYPNDVGYETDVDGGGVENDPLLPSYIKRKKRVYRRDYGSTLNNSFKPNQKSGSSTLNQSIRTPINIDRNIPGYSQY